MAEHDIKKCLIECDKQTSILVKAWFDHGDEEHDGSGLDFVHQMAFSLYATAAGASYIRGCNTQQETARLNGLVQASPYGFAALPIPADELMMYGLLPALVFMECQRRNTEGQKGGSYSNATAFRDAARLAIRLSREEPSRVVAMWAAKTDADIANDDAINSLRGFAPEGKAN